MLLNKSYLPRPGPNSRTGRSAGLRDGRGRSGNGMADGSFLFTVFSRLLGLMSRGGGTLALLCARVGYRMPVLYGTAQRRVRHCTSWNLVCPARIHRAGLSAQRAEVGKCFNTLAFPPSMPTSTHTHIDRTHQDLHCGHRNTRTAVCWSPPPPPSIIAPIGSSWHK